MLSVISLGTLNSDLMSDLRDDHFIEYSEHPKRERHDTSRFGAVRNICEWGLASRFACAPSVAIQAVSSTPPSAAAAFRAGASNTPLCKVLLEQYRSLPRNGCGGSMQIDAIRPYRAMAHNNRWANHRLLTACARLSHAEFTAPRTGFFPTLAATLNHILVVDRFYVDAMEGGRLGPAAWSEPEPCKTVAALRESQEEVDRRLIAVVESLEAGSLERIVELQHAAGVQREPIDRVLLHLFQHQVHHRGQVHAMLSGTSVRPPQLDEFFLAEEAPLRAAEFAELGWTEDIFVPGPRR
jgi:uncharacterized damage-inducible protein DinB